MFAKGILAKGPFMAPAGQASGRHFVDAPPTNHEMAPPWREVSTPCTVSPMDTSSASFAHTPMEAYEAEVMSSDPAVEEFVSRWGLDSSCVSFLETLPDDARTKVLEQFEPRRNTQNVSAKLRAFANTIVTGQGRISSQPPPAEPRSPLFTGAPSSASVPSPEEESAFLERWGLSGNQTAVDVLRRLHPPVRMRVMREFAPGQGTQDVLGKFCGFAVSVAKSAAKEGASHLPPLRAPSRHVAAPWAQPSRATNVPSHAATGSMTPEQFADRWQLDAGSRALLSGLDLNAQATVIEEFQPRGDVRDMSGKFCAFARSVASRVQSRTPGQKRPMSTTGFAGPPIYRPRY